MLGFGKKEMQKVTKYMLMKFSTLDIKFYDTMYC